MDLDEGKDKFYININVQHDPTNGFSSEADVRYKFDRPLIDKSGNYQVCVTDMQVDTKNVPLFIAEFQKTQEKDILRDRDDMLKTLTNRDVKLNYWVMCYANYVNGEKVYLKKPVRLTMSPWLKEEDKKYQYENNNQNAFIYSHQEFLDMINIALDAALPDDYRGKSICGFIIRNERLMFIVQDYNLYLRLTGQDAKIFKIYFSNSLYQYIGVGFPVINRISYWEYDFVPSVAKQAQVPFYYTLSQTESTLQSWNGCKAIVCYTKDLPIAEEVFPTTVVKPHLSHYGSSVDSVDSHYSLGKGDKKILFVHYIDYNRIKTLSNGIVVHNMCIDDGLKIDLDKTLPIDTFDVHIGWMDSYGNLFPLRLTYGSCCNVRLCFTRKKVVENYDYTKGPGTLPMGYIPYSTDYYYYDPQPPEMMQQPVDDTKQSLYYTPSMDTELQQQLLQEQPPPPQLPVEPLTLFANHLQELAEQQQQQQEQAVVAEPVIPTEEVIPPLLDEKEQFYQRQQEILNQYKEFNNKLN